MAAIVALGELLAEIMAEEVGQTFTAPGRFLGPYPSGAPGIFADQAARMGASTAMIGCVGADGFGDLIVDRLREDGVDVSGIRRSRALATGVAFVTYRSDGSREFIFHLGNSAAGEIDAAAVDENALAGCRYLHVMGSSLADARTAAAVERAVAIVKREGGRVSFDPNIRAEMFGAPTLRQALDRVLKACDLLLLSEADLAHFCGDVPEAEAIAALFARHAIRMIGVKRGAHGSSYYDRERHLRVPAFRTLEVDPTGAGDCFGGTLVACLVQGIEIERALTLANAAGALAVARRGPMEGNSTLAELERFIASAERLP